MAFRVVLTKALISGFVSAWPEIAFEAIVDGYAIILRSRVLTIRYMIQAVFCHPRVLTCSASDEV